MPGEGKARRDHHPENHKSGENRIYEKNAGHGYPQPECLYPQNGTGWLLPEPRPAATAAHVVSLQMCSNNLNQYAKRANESGKIYATDMEDLRQRLDELIDIGRQILSKLAEL